ncbi:MAG TPA: PAS domain S-box protein [Kamptonema sp.]|nr:PAS domain S-box protein [Kamptonema sp.]
MSSPLSYDPLLDRPVDTDDSTLLLLRDRQLRTLFEMALDGIAIADDRGCYLDVNPATCELFGLERKELLGRCIIEFAEPGYDFQQAWQEFQQQEKVRGEFRLVRPDGNIRIVEYAATANFLPHRHLSVMRDITERKLAEAQVRELTQQLDRQVPEPVSELEQTQAQLRESQQRLESILNSIEGVVWSIHPETFETIYINPAVEQVFGCSVAEFFANPNLWFEIIHPDDRHIITNAFVILKEKGKTRTEYRIIRRDGQVRWLSVNSHLVYDETGKPIRIDGITTDISDRIESESRLEQIARHIPGAIYQFRQRPDGSFHFPYSSEGLREICGVSPEEVREDASKVFGIIHSDDCDRVTQSILESAENITHWYCEYRVCFPDGRILWLVGNATPQRELDGSTLWHGYIQDISDRKATEIALVQSENKFRSIIENLNDMVYIINLDATFSYVTPQFKEVMGYEVAELLDKSFGVFIYPQDFPIFMDAFHLASQGEKVRGIEYRILHYDGNYYWHSSNLSALRDDEDGQVVACLGIARYIHDQKQAEITLQESNSRWQLAIEGAGDGTWDWNLKTNEVNFSRQWKAMLGYEDREIVNALEEWESRIHPDDKAQCYEDFTKHLSDETSVYRNEHRLRCKDGTYKWILDRGQVIEWDKEGQPLRFIGTHCDISDRKTAELELEQFFSLALDLLCIADFSGYFRRMNRAWEKILGYSAKELEGQLFLEFVHPDDIASTLEVMSNLSEHNPVFHFTNRYRAKDGNYRYLEWRAVPCGDLIYAAARDITERKQAEIENWEIQQFLNLIIENIPNMLFVKDAENLQFLRFNKAGEELLGYPKEVLLGKSDYDFFPPEEADFFIAKDRETLTNGKVLDIPEEQVQTNHQGTRILHTRKIPILDELGNPKYLLGISEDITARKQAEAQLKEISERLSLALKSGRIGCWEWDILQNSLFWDERMYELYGATKNSETRLAYEIWATGLHPDDRDAVEILIHQAVLGQTEYDTEFRVVHPDGSIHVIKAFGIVQRNAEGNPQTMIGVNFDISDRKEAERNLRQNEQKYHQILDAITDMVLVKGPKSRIVWANKAFRDYYAMTNEQLQDMIDAPFNEPDYTLQYIRDDAYVFETGQTLEIEEPVTRYDGKVQLFNTIKSVIRNEAGEKILTVGVSRNITERKRQEQALRLIVEGTAAKTGEDFFKSCVQYLAQVLEVRYAFIAEFIDSEKMSAKTLAFWAGEDFGPNFTYNLVGAPCENVYSEGELCIYPNSVQSLFPEDYDLVALQAESYAGLPIIDAAGNRLGLLAVLDAKPMVQDIEIQSAILRIFATRAGAEIERIKAEVAVRKSEIQLRLQSEELTTTLKRLQTTQTQLIQSEKMSSLGQLVAGVAHEINNPVSFIYGNLQPAADYASDLIDLIHLYQEHYPSPPQAISKFIEDIELEYLISDFSNLVESMKTGATRISDIVKSLRTFSRLDEADLKYIDIHENIESTLIILQNRLNVGCGNKEVFVVKNYGKLPLIECYGGLLNQVFLNLLVNSIDAIEQKRSSLELSEQLDYIGCITITTSINLGNQAIVSIYDNGCGMIPEVQEKIFNPFFTTKPVGKGTGMGLATSYQIVNENHRGRLRCCSTPGEGTEFIIELPICEPK